MEKKTRRILFYAVCILGMLFCGVLTSCSMFSYLISGVPAAPTGVSATAAVWNPTVVTDSGTGGGQTTISWDSVWGAVSYNLYWTYTTAGTVEPTEGPGPSTFESTNPITGTSHTFTMSTADPVGKIFHFAVSAVDANDNEGPLSSVVTATVPSP